MQKVKNSTQSSTLKKGKNTIFQRKTKGSKITKKHGHYEMKGEIQFFKRKQKEAGKRIN